MKPLIERFGNNFFLAAPREPGVYVMRDGGEQILYIGQSKNLRTRLAYYKNANPDRMPRRLVRLVHAVEAISWECCPSAEAARARELQLLQLHRPRFNRADTGPQFFHFIQIETSQETLRARLHFDNEPALENCLGPIRGKMIPTLALPALQRLWKIAFAQTFRCADLPIIPKRLSEIELQGPAAALAGVAAFLSGQSNEIVTALLAIGNSEMEPPLRQLQEADAELLLSWWRAISEIA
jgi:excinuclease UvrABC nuclease subunit